MRVASPISRPLNAVPLGPQQKSNSNYPVINQSRGWGRINLVDAADGYGAFDHDVELYMNASLGGFNAQDRWRNDISGIGRLHKLGTGSLSLEGHNTYTGGTLLDEGTLIATSSTAFGSNVLYQKDGTVEVSIATGKDDRSQGELNVSDYVMIAGTLSLNLANNAHIKASNNLYVADTLQLTIPTITTSQTYQILSGHRLYGTFKTISAQDKNGVSYAVSIQYTDNSASVTVSPRAS
ncbi:autotransporter-associated beta strand repeat-containing protein [Vibrio sp. PP-XX7]